MKKWSLTLKVFLSVLAVAILYVLIASIVRVSMGQIEIGMAVTRFFIGSIIGVLVAGIAAGITAIVVAIRKKKKFSLPLKVFLIVAAVCILYVLIASIVRVYVGEISISRAVIRFIIFGLIGGSLVGGVAAGITALAVAIKKLGE